MPLSILDIVLIILLFVFAFSGFFFGLIRSVGAVVSLVVGLIAAANYFPTVTTWLGNPFGLSNQIMTIVAFLIVFIIANRLVSFIFWAISKVFNLPFLKSIDRLGGLILNLAAGSLILGVALVLVARLSFASNLTTMIEESQIASFLFGLGTWLTPQLPEFLNQAKGVFEEIKP